MSSYQTRIDPRLSQVHPEQVRAYMTAHGWRQEPYPRPEVWVFTKPKSHDEGRLTLVAGASADLDDYLVVLEDLIKALTVWEDSYFTEILTEMLRYPAGTTNGAAHGEAKRATPSQPAP